MHAHTPPSWCRDSICTGVVWRWCAVKRRLAVRCVKSARTRAKERIMSVALKSWRVNEGPKHLIMVRTWEIYAYAVTGSTQARALSCVCLLSRWEVVSRIVVLYLCVLFLRRWFGLQWMCFCSGDHSCCTSAARSITIYIRCWG